MGSGGFGQPFFQTQAQAVLEKTSQAHPCPGGLGLRLPVEAVINAKRGLHDSKVSYDSFLQMQSFGGPGKTGLPTGPGWVSLRPWNIMFIFG